jgi:regulator of replication initiation timing
MKKILTSMLIALVAFSLLTACSDESSSDKKNPEVIQVEKELQQVKEENAKLKMENTKLRKRMETLVTNQNREKAKENE